jgi:uncharacterized membrane protein YwaF
MKQSLFYFVLAILAIIYLVLIGINVDDGQPFKFIPVFAVIMLITTLLYSALMGWGIKYFLILTAGVCILCFFFGLFNAIMNSQSFECFGDPFLYGSRVTTLVWLITVSILGAIRFDKQETKKKEELAKAKKEEKV